MPPHVLALFAAQSGVATRDQLIKLGLTDKDVARWRRQRMVVRLGRGVYVDHTGEPTWEQRCWAAVLGAAPSALAGVSACRWAEGAASRRQSGVIEVAVPWEYRRVVAPGVRVVRRRDLDALLHPGSGLPRLRYEHAVIDVVAAAQDGGDRVAELALALNSRRTTAARLSAALAARARVPGRAALEQLLDDLTAGTCSVLEHGFLTRVERPHGLPATQRQVRDVVRGSTVYRDAVSRHGVCIELDGRLHERIEQRERDFDRDLVAAAGDLLTVRLSYGQVFNRSCWTAGRLACLYRARGWEERLVRCGPTCSVE